MLEEYMDRFLIEMAVKQLIKDVQFTCSSNIYYEIKKEHNYYEIEFTIIQKNENEIIERKVRIRPNNFVAILSNYQDILNKLKEGLLKIEAEED